MRRLLILCFWSVSAVAQPPDSERRVALIVGNSEYKIGPKLANPSNDARAMAQRLGELRFDIVLKLDATQRDMDDALRVFTDKLGPGVVAVFFYAGHGFQIDGVNYLLPIDFGNRGTDGQSVKYGSIPADDVLERMEKSNSRLNLLFLDACRNNPFIKRSKRSAEKGLAAMEPPKGAAIMFATDAGKTADDNPGEQNGIFTKHLLAALHEPGLSLGEISEVVRDNVMLATNGEQNPTYFSKAGRFVLNPGTRASRGGTDTIAPLALPQISSLLADRTDIEPNQSMTLRVKANDPNAEPLHYSWYASAGRIEGRGEAAVFSPGPPGSIPSGSPVTVTVTARNSRGLEARKEISLKINAPAPVMPQTIVGRAIPMGPNIEVWLDAQAGTGSAVAGTIEAELDNVEHVWQVIHVQGGFPGLPIDASVECRNCNVIAFVDQPNSPNGFLRARVRLQPINSQPMTLRLHYQPSTRKVNKKR